MSTTIERTAATAGPASHDPPFRMRGLAMTRIETFTDAAFAFALTLLVISLDPPTSFAAMLETLRVVPAFVLSATILMMFWWGHHNWSRRYGLDDGWTLVLSCVLVFTVLVYVYPLRFMFGMMSRWIGSLTGLPIGPPEMVITSAREVGSVFLVYGVGFIAMCTALLALHVHAWRKRDELELTPHERHDAQTGIGVWLLLTGAGVLSILAVLLLPAHLVGLAGWAYSLLAVVMPVYGRRRGRSRRSLGASGGQALS